MNEGKSGFVVRCNMCGKQVSNVMPIDIIVRAWVECPECIEKYRNEDGSMNEAGAKLTNGRD